MAIIDAAGAAAVGVAISLDRQERGTGPLSAVQELEREFGLTVIRIAGLDDLARYLAACPELAPDLARLRAYRARYGARG